MTRLGLGKIIILSIISGFILKAVTESIVDDAEEHTGNIRVKRSWLDALDKLREKTAEVKKKKSRTRTGERVRGSFTNMEARDDSTDLKDLLPVITEVSIDPKLLACNNFIAKTAAISRAKEGAREYLKALIRQTMKNEKAGNNTEDKKDLSKMTVSEQEKWLEQKQKELSKEHTGKVFIEELAEKRSRERQPDFKIDDRALAKLDKNKIGRKGKQMYEILFAEEKVVTSEIPNFDLKYCQVNFPSFFKDEGNEEESSNNSNNDLPTVSQPTSTQKTEGTTKMNVKTTTLPPSMRAHSEREAVMGELNEQSYSEVNHTEFSTQFPPSRFDVEDYVAIADGLHGDVIGIKDLVGSGETEDDFISKDSTDKVIEMRDDFDDFISKESTGCEKYQWDTYKQCQEDFFELLANVDGSSKDTDACWISLELIDCYTANIKSCPVFLMMDRAELQTDREKLDVLHDFIESCGRLFSEDGIDETAMKFISYFKYLLTIPSNEIFDSFDVKLS